MIIKERDPYEAQNNLEKAGMKAEEKMAWYLKRAFSKSKDIDIFHDVRLQFDENDYLQMDHLVFHPYGFLLIESKSVSSEVRIDRHGHWERLWNKQWVVMPSPVRQVEVQADSFYQILKEKSVFLRTKVIFGLLQRNFDRCPFDTIVAISNLGRIRGHHDDKVMKAEDVCDAVKQHILVYAKQRKNNDKYMPTLFREEERKKMKSFLLHAHQPKYKKTAKKSTKKIMGSIRVNKPKSSKLPPPSLPLICKKCHESFEIRYKYSFYLYCPNCRTKPKTLQASCPQCQADVTLERQVGTRIVEYQCQNHAKHLGVFHTNREIYTRDNK
ncbi:MAG: NERD domain-containing protein [Mariprofundaceae bacterium]|nr:NERD domain-containing protein [Mariprofundaceae bacterium]